MMFHVGMQACFFFVVDVQRGPCPCLCLLVVLGPHPPYLLGGGGRQGPRARGLCWLAFFFLFFFGTLRILHIISNFHICFSTNPQVRTSWWWGLPYKLAWGNRLSRIALARPGCKTAVMYSSLYGSQNLPAEHNSPVTYSSQYGSAPVPPQVYYWTGRHSKTNGKTQLCIVRKSQEKPLLRTIRNCR